MPKIVVTVNPDGTTKVDFVGYTGPSCMDADDKLRKLMQANGGVEIEQTSFEEKPELYIETEAQRRSQKEQA